METLSTENIAENIVADILKSFTQSSSSEVSTETKVTSFSKQKQAEDGKTKTEMTVQSRVQENIDVSAEAGQGSLSNQDVRKVLESAEGTPSKQEIEDIVHHGLKGSGDAKSMSVNVEIVEETVDYATDERTDFSTPFEVEEVEDTFPEKEKRYGDEEQDITLTYEDLKKKKQHHESFTHVEEVTEEDDSPIEQKYFVSVPDDHPIINEKDDDSVYGQIHIEEESTIKYSWQDEFLQGTQSKRDEGVSSPEETYRVVGEEATAHILKEEHPKAGTSHVESVVIEKEIKIPQEFQASIKGLLSKETKDPKQQLKEALEQLEGSLPESVKEELSALTKESQADSSNLEFDIKKVHQTEEGGLLTIVAEVNLSQTLNADEFNVAEFGEVIAGEKEKTTSHSLKRDKLERVDGKISTETDVSAHSDIHTPVANQEVYRSSTVRKSGSTGYHTTEKVIYDGSVLETAHFGEDSHSPESTDESKSVRHIRVGPTEVQRFEQIVYEGPGSEMLSATEDVVQKEGSSEMSHSVKHFKLGPKEIQTTEEVIYRGPITTTVEEMDSGNLSQQTFSSDISRSTRHVTVGSRQVIEEVSFEGPGSDSLELNSSGNLSQTEGSVDVSRSVRQFRLHPKEIHSEQVIFEGPISGKVEVSDSRDFSQTESSVRHIQLGPKEFMTAEKVFYQGPITEHIEISEVGDQTHSESSIRHFRLGQTGVKTTERIIYQGSLSETPDLINKGHLPENAGSSDISTSFRHVRITPVETQTEQIIFTRPISETLEDHSQTRESSESSSSMKHVKVGSSETSFTFQRDVSNVGGVSIAESEEQATMLIPNKQGPSVNQSQFRVESDHRGDSENKRSYVHSSFSQDHVENTVEKSGFEKTVQLQRMVDQRSVISDEKKVALLYLDHEEEDDEENDGQWF
uniref:Synemin n=1 Tax=Chrysolophus pictus TaxID=9089 RepID=A0A8C3L071_CHRPC